MKDFESGYCTHARCRTFLKDGDGQQFVREDGEVDRYCERHAKEECFK